MKPKNTRKMWPPTGMTMLGIVIAALLGSITITPAFAEDGRKDMGRHDNNRYEQKDRGHDRSRAVHNRRDNRPYGHRDRVYMPPRVMYAPPPPPGIGIFFPPIFIRP